MLTAEVSTRAPPSRSGQRIGVRNAPRRKAPRRGIQAVFRGAATPLMGVLRARRVTGSRRRCTRMAATVLAEFERARVSERVRAGLPRARRQGKQLGPPRLSRHPSASRYGRPPRPGVCRRVRRLGGLVAGPRLTVRVLAASASVAANESPRRGRVVTTGPCSDRQKAARLRTKNVSQADLLTSA